MTPTPRIPADAYAAANILIAAMAYELPTHVHDLATDGDLPITPAQWTDRLAGRLSLFRSHCLARRPPADVLATRIRRQAQVLLVMLELTYCEQGRGIFLATQLESVIADLINAPESVLASLQQWQRLRLTGWVDQVSTDTLGFMDDFFTGQCGETDLKTYHVINRQ